jgi:uncharacterized membrane protein
MSENDWSLNDWSRVVILATSIPIYLLSISSLLSRGQTVYGGVLLLFGGFFMAAGIYMNWKRLASDEKIDDERMRQVNQKAGFSAFWTMIMALIVWGVLRVLLVALTPLTESMILDYDTLVLIFIGFASYLAFRAYYLNFGVENKFWRPDK